MLKRTRSTRILPFDISGATLFAAPQALLSLPLPLPRRRFPFERWIMETLLHPSTMVDGVGGGVIHSKMMIDHERDSMGYFKLDPRTSMGAFNIDVMELFLFRCARVVTP